MQLDGIDCESGERAYHLRGIRSALNSSIGNNSPQQVHWLAESERRIALR